MSLGRIVWHELVSTDAERAADFYSKLFEWKRTSRGWEHRLTTKAPSGEDHPVASITQLPSEAADGLPSLWMVYVHVGDEGKDMDTVLTRAGDAGLEAGSRRMVRSEGASRLGFQLLAQRSAALTVPMAHNQVSSPAARNRKPMVGCFCWNQLTVHRDRVGGLAKDFEAVFGWKLSRNGEPHGTFHTGDGLPVAGWHEMDPESRSPDHWLPFVCVEDVEATIEGAEAAGGQLLAGPEHPTEKAERFAVLEDPTGGVIGIRGWVASVN